MYVYILCLHRLILKVVSCSVYVRSIPLSYLSSSPPPSHHHSQLKFNFSTLSPSPPAQVHLLLHTPTPPAALPPHTVLKFIYPRPPFTSCPPSPLHLTQVTKDPHLPVTQIKHDLEEVCELKLTLDQATYSLDLTFSIRSFLSGTVPASFPGREALTGEYTQR